MVSADSHHCAGDKYSLPWIIQCSLSWIIHFRFLQTSEPLKPLQNFETETFLHTKFTMTKSIFPNFEKWTTDEKRLLVILLLTLIYPVFVTSFYALYLFVILPSWVSPSTSFKDAHQKGWYHTYWVVVSMFWVIICFIILPLFKKKKVHHALHMGNIESSPYGKKMHTEAVIKIEVKDAEDSQSKSSRKSGDSSDSSVKDGSVLDVGKEESFERSRESLSKSCTSLERKKLTQSGEFLNDFMSTIKSEETAKTETVCEVHAEENKGHHKTGSDSDRESVEKEKNHQSPEISLKATEVETSQQKYSEDSNGSEGPSDKKKTHSKKDSDTSSEDSSSDEDPETSVVTKEAKSPQVSSPLKISEAMVEQNEEVEILEVTEEVDKLDSDVPQGRRKKATPTVDTSRASGYYECSLPSPKPVESVGSQSNKVFLYVNPDAAATEENILLSHGGEVEKSAVKEADV